MTWTEKMDGFLDHLGAERRSEAYRHNVKAILRRFGESTGWKEPIKVTKTDVEGWVADLNGKLAPSTVGGYLTILKAAMRYWASEEGWDGGETPACVRGLKLAGVRETRVRSEGEMLTEDDYRKLLSVMTPDKALIFRLLWDTGARAGEVLNLRREDVTWKDEGSLLSFRKTKNGTPRLAPVVNRTTIELLRARCEITPPGGYLFPSPGKEGSPLRVGGVWRYLNRAGERAGIKDKRLYLHLFRYAATKRLAGLPGGLRRKMLGWSRRSQMEDRYEFLETDDLMQALHDLEGETDPLAARLAAAENFMRLFDEHPEAMESLERVLSDPALLEQLRVWFPKK